jgi:hypothetical protein
MAPREAGLSGRDQASSGAGAFGRDAARPPSSPASRAAEDRRFERPPGRPLPPPALDDDLPPPDDMEFETEPDFDDATSFTDSFGRPDVPTDRARIEAQRSEAPSAMRKVEHGVTIDGRDTFKMAEKLQKNDTTLRFLAASNFDADEGVEVIDTRSRRPSSSTTRKAPRRRRRPAPPIRSRSSAPTSPRPVPPNGPSGYPRLWRLSRASRCPTSRPRSEAATSRI